MQRPSYNNPPPAHSPPRMYITACHVPCLWTSMMGVPTTLLSSTAEHVLIYAKSTTPFHNTSPQSPSYDHHRPHNPLRNHTVHMAMANRAALCHSSRSSSSNSSKGATTRILPSAASSTTPPPNWVSRWEKVPWMLDSSTWSKTYVCEPPLSPFGRLAAASRFSARNTPPTPYSTQPN